MAKQLEYVMSHRSPLMAISAVTVAALSLAVLSTTASAVNINLSTWTAQGPGNGNWAVQAGNETVLQTVNTSTPTYFVSMGNFNNTTFNGKFQVQTGSDDDFIGFVFGYGDPIGAPNTDFKFLLFDWKQSNQSGSASEGFSLNYANGDFSGTPLGGVNASNPFWNNDLSLAGPPMFENIVTDFGGTRGWADNTEYEFTLLYQTNRIKIDIKGGVGDFMNGQTIFDITPAAVANLGAFPDGRFGFYNFSQSTVLYEGFTQVSTPGCGTSGQPACPVSVPEPGSIGSLALFGLGLAGLAYTRRRKTA